MGTDPKHVRQAVIQVLYNNTDLSHERLQSLYDKIIDAMTTPKETIRCGEKAVTASRENRNRLIKVVSALAID